MGAKLCGCEDNKEQGVDAEKSVKYFINK